jgi:DinB superfamily
MPVTMAALLAFHYQRTHARFLKAIEGLSDADLRRQWPHANSIGFDAWHCARWADQLQMLIAKMTPSLRDRLGPREQIWVKEGLLRKWGYPTAGLGHVETGVGMDESMAATLPLPEKGVLLDYVRRSFAASEQTVARLADDDLLVEALLSDDDSAPR